MEPRNLGQKTFAPAVETLGFLSEYSQEQIRQETMFVRCDRDFVTEHAGPITLQFLQFLEGEGWVIDTKLHQLRPGWLPCVGGYHLDCIPRDGENYQPRYLEIEDLCQDHDHVLAVLSRSSLTEFVQEPITLNAPREGELVYASFNRQILELKQQNPELTRHVKSGEVLRFNSEALHTGHPATESEWRLFMRACKHETKVLNEIRNQVQVYVKDFESSW
eukprot:TRINITY_DN334_c0_g1_i2.p1 TRINITY_DN334_c0_g1~~TRINITY_DN334_c0_g1_i2.p1  ORF type:complete len:219 (+),score=43.42 TRINITY_DN334_c0_g1_i2:36-692(+)